MIGDGLKNKNLVPYRIAAPDYRHTSMGIRVLYELHKELKYRGIPATIGNYQTRSTDRRFIAVYPRIRPGNPLNAPVSVRYIMSNLALYPPENPDEIVFTYSVDFRKDLKPVGKLFIIPIELDLFNDFDTPERHGSLYYHGKGGTKSNPPDNARVIDNKNPPERTGLAAILRSSKTLYCDDPLTSLTAEAVLCGCKVVCPGVQWVQEFGINPQPEELRSKIILYQEESLPVQIENFINITQAAYEKLHT